MSKSLEVFNAASRHASRLADALLTFCEGHANAVASGAEIIDLRLKPNAQPSYALTDEAAQRLRDAGERLPRRVSPKTFDEADLRMVKVPGYVPACSADDVRASLLAIIALRRQAKLAAYLARKHSPIAEQTWEQVVANLQEEVVRLEALDPALTEVATAEFEKAHLVKWEDGVDQDTNGFHQTVSLKGDATVTRYTEDREVRSNSKRDMTHAAYTPASLDEDAMLEVIAA